MRKTVQILAIVAGIHSFACANEHNTTGSSHLSQPPAAATHHEEHTAAHHHPTAHHNNGFFIAAKALISLPSTVHEHDKELTSTNGYGAGIDIGYHLPYNFAVEMDVSYDQNTVTEAHEIAVGNYWTYALDVTYTYHIMHKLGIEAKFGYEYERENVDELSLHKNMLGIVYGVSLEYALQPSYDFLVEYENSTIASVRGASIFSGVRYHF